MHVQANMTAYQLSENILTNDVIPWFTNFTLLFMIISAFSMCCGYYERIKTGAITPAKFYSKRYHRTWPLYAIGSKDIVLNNRVAKYLSGIRMEIYLCLMMFYRVASMLHLDKFIHNNDILYVATCIMTLIGAICFSYVIKYVMSKTKRK